MLAKCDSTTKRTIGDSCFFFLLEKIILQFNTPIKINIFICYVYVAISHNFAYTTLVVVTSVLKRFFIFFVTAVRFGRVPKREKARILAAMQQSSNSKCQEKAAVAELEDDQRLVASVVRAHLETCDFTSDKVAPTLARAREQPNYTLCHPTLVSANCYIIILIIIA